MILWKGTATGTQPITPEVQAELDRRRAARPEPATEYRISPCCRKRSRFANGATYCGCGAVRLLKEER